MKKVWTDRQNKDKDSRLGIPCVKNSHHEILLFVVCFVAVFSSLVLNDRVLRESNIYGI